MAASFRKYETALGRQVAGRTPLLNNVLESIETRAAVIHKDLRVFSKKNADDSRYDADVSLLRYQQLTDNTYTANCQTNSYQRTDQMPTSSASLSRRRYLQVCNK